MAKIQYGVKPDIFKYAGRTPCSPSSCLLLPFVFGVLPAGATTTPPQAVPPGTGRVLALAPFGHGRLPHASSFCFTATLKLLGLTPVGFSTLDRKLSGPTSSSLAASVTNSNHRLGDLLYELAPTSSLSVSFAHLA